MLAVVTKQVSQDRLLPLVVLKCLAELLEKVITQRILHNIGAFKPEPGPHRHQTLLDSSRRPHTLTRHRYSPRKGRLLRLLTV